MKMRKYHIIQEGVRYKFDVNWYLSNGYVTLESIRERCEHNGRTEDR